MNRTKTQEHLKYLVLTALFAAMTYVLIAFLHINTNQGYFHFGDGMIYIAASLLPMPYAMAAGAIGGGLSDLLSGYAIWVLPTALIKAATAACFSRKNEKMICVRNLIALIPALVICVGGYYLAGGLLYGDFKAALIDIPTNIIQSLGSAVLFVLIGLALDRAGFKKKFLAYTPRKIASLN